MRPIRFGSVSITGNHRENNEDRCLADPDGRFFLVADGMGGQAAGERASELAIELVSKRLSRSINFEQGDPENVTSTINAAITEANNEIMALGKIDPSSHNMGTTISFLVAGGDRLFIGGIGDSRVYRVCDDDLEQLTTDHSLTQALIDAGTITEDEAANHRYRNVLYRYLGTKEGGNEADIRQLQPGVGDRFVLCSDGVTDGLDEKKLLKVLRDHPDDPQAAADAVVEAALQGGSKDNITCVVVDVG